MILHRTEVTEVEQKQTFQPLQHIIMHKLLQSISTNLNWRGSPGSIIALLWPLGMGSWDECQLPSPLVPADRLAIAKYGQINTNVVKKNPAILMLVKLCKGSGVVDLKYDEVPTNEVVGVACFFTKKNTKRTAVREWAHQLERRQVNATTTHCVVTADSTPK